jgi:hypothetical protein
VNREAAVAFKPPTHFAFQLLSGLPIEGYRAEWRRQDPHHVGVTLRKARAEGVVLPSFHPVGRETLVE